MEFAIEIDNLTKDYETGFLRKKRVRALDGLTLTVRPGQIFGFLGGNGAGKTTTIKMLMRLIFPASGSASVLGRDIADVEMHRFIGYCPENPYFYDYLTPRELLAYFGSLYGQDKRRSRDRGEVLLTAVGLAERDRSRQMRKFSKGMLQRVALAQSLINEPEVVFMDEPMSGLDPVGRREVRELIAGLRDRGTTVFMSTHILSDVEALCDEVAILRGGRLAASGTLSELLFGQETSRTLEISVQGVEADALREAIDLVAGAVLFPRPDGAAIHVQDETDIEAVLRITRTAGGRLVSVQPVKQALEDLFVSDSNASLIRE